MLRRNLLTASALAVPAGLLAACAVTSSNGTTTVTLNLATVDNYATAAENAATLLLGISPVAGAIGVAGMATITAVLAGIKAAISALDTQYAGQASFSFTSTIVPAALSSLQADIAQLFASFEAVWPAVGGKVPAQAVTYYNAFSTVASLVEALYGTVVGIKPLPMSGSQALAVLGV